MIVFIDEWDNDYGVITNRLRKEFSSIEEAEGWCVKESWSGYSYDVDINLTNAMNKEKTIGKG